MIMIKNKKAKGTKKCIMEQKNKSEFCKKCLEENQLEQKIKLLENHKCPVDSLKENHKEFITY